VFPAVVLDVQAGDGIRLILQGLKLGGTEVPALGLDSSRSSAAIESRLYTHALEVLQTDLETLAQGSTPQLHFPAGEDPSVTILTIIKRLQTDPVMQQASVRFPPSRLRLCVRTVLSADALSKRSQHSGHLWKDLHSTACHAFKGNMNWTCVNGCAMTISMLDMCSVPNALSLF
jgi:hypothetical protein